MHLDVRKSGIPAQQHIIIIILQTATSSPSLTVPGLFLADTNKNTVVFTRIDLMSLYMLCVADIDFLSAHADVRRCYETESH